MGSRPISFATDLNNALSGATATTLKINGEEIDVNLSLSDTYKNSIDNMQQILITTGTGGTVPVGQIATLTFDNSPSQIDRADQQRYINVNINTDNSNLGAISDKVLALVKAYNFPDGYSYESGGMYQQMVDSFGDLFLALIVAILLVYMVLASQFESLTQPLIIMMAIPFAMSGSVSCALPDRKDALGDLFPGSDHARRDRCQEFYPPGRIHTAKQRPDGS